jgi:hypothetical protein
MKYEEFDSWSDFSLWVDRGFVGPVYWRGQKNSKWPLASSFERKILNMFGGEKRGASMVYPYDGRYERDGKPIYCYQSMRDRYLEAFKSAATGLRGPNPAQLDTDEWWALGRHFGLVTPLLDWSESPYIAVFFPLSELLSEMLRADEGTYFDETVAVFMLRHSDFLEGDGLRVVRPRVEELSRMHGQRGVFTWLNSERFLELEGFVDNTGRGDLLTKVVLSSAVVMDGVRHLRTHGIDYRLLFPDLFGAALHANTQHREY